MKKTISERKITRQFLDAMINENYYQGQSKEELRSDMHGNLSPETLHTHFDLDGDGQVSQQDYVDHINYHCAHPESLDHYNKLCKISQETVPCVKSYDSCSQHLLSNPDQIDICLKPLMDASGSTCRESSVKSLLDVLQSLINCGVFG